MTLRNAIATPIFIAAHGAAAVLRFTGERLASTASRLHSVARKLEGNW